MPEVIGAICDKWIEPRAENSFLRRPITDEMEFFEDGQVSVFEGGAIYWFPEFGAVAMGEMFVHCTGLNCFRTTGGAEADEPYLVMGVTPIARPSFATRSQIYGEVDGGDTRPDVTELYRRPPVGLTIIYQLMEHDHGNPDDHHQTMEGAAAAAGVGASHLVKLVPGVGPILSVATEMGMEILSPIIGDALGGLLGIGDDRIGDGTLVLSPRDMVRMTIQPNLVERQVGFKVASPLLSVDGGDHKVYFDAVKTP